MSPVIRQRAESTVRSLLTFLGHDLEQEGMKDTPRRFVSFLEDFSKPLSPDFRFTLFKTDSTGMIVQSPVPVISLCMHHLLPITGYATIGYLPGTEMVGLSKLKRVVDMICMRPQTQERLTKQLVNFIRDGLDAPGAGVVVTAQHNCMSHRGVRVADVWTTTTELIGSFKNDPTTRAEFLAHHKYP
jgi:GTP cyclohydrolase IA